MNTTSIPSHRQNYGETRPTSTIKYIVVHYTANDGDTATGNGNYFKNNVVKSSAHYFVDDNTIVQSVPDNYIAWAVGGNKYPNTNQTGGGKFYGKCTNANSISIELCDTVKNGKSDFTKKTLDNAIYITKRLMEYYNIPVDDVIRHFDVTGKLCPLPFIDNIVWQDFKNQITGGVKMTTEERQKFNGLVEAVEKLTARVDELSKPMIYNYIDKNMPDWARPTIQKLVGNGKLVGNEKGELGLTDDMLRLLVILDRQGIFG